MLNCKGIVKYLLSCFSQISYLITPLDLSTENYKNSSISLSFSVLFLIVLLLQSEKLMCELWGVSFQGLLKQMYSNNKMADFFFFVSDTMPVRILASSLAKRFCDRKFTDAFAAFVACSLEPSSFSIPVLTAMMQIMQSSFCSKAAVDSVYNFFISAFFFPSFVY